LSCLFAKENRRVVLDLAEVTLVDGEVVKFLALCEGNGVKLNYARITSVSGSAKSERKSIK